MYKRVYIYLHKNPAHISPSRSNRQFPNVDALSCWILQILITKTLIYSVRLLRVNTCYLRLYVVRMTHKRAGACSHKYSDVMVFLTTCWWENFNNVERGH